jgi:hypothetical protein
MSVALRQKLKGWNNNVEGMYKKTRKIFVDTIENLDKIVESSSLNGDDRYLDEV